ncbi:MAG TPA: DUF3857 domain-containing protein, partial [Candidatus Acidoferrum sp.]|nr:DUF3857 domain-containing protein [Candidatus Acidoferrum sp.]
ENVVGIRARTIRPDGSIVNFDGKVYEKEIVKARGVKFLAKTFTLSDVQAGSIIEYHYMVDFAENYVFNSHWTLSEELFTKLGKYSCKPYGQFALQWSWPNGLPQGTAPPQKQTDARGDFIRMEARDIPAFQVEDDMPPENAIKFMVDFIYSDGDVEREPEKYWKKRGKRLYDQAESFVGKRKAMEQAVSEIVSPNDSPETKLQKIYARVQQLRNTSFEREKTEQEQKREKEKEINNVEDLWKRGYGNGYQITWLFLGLARAAGFDASPVMISTRDDHFLRKNLMNGRDLRTNVVVVRLDGKDKYFDPGYIFTPFGLLPWFETDTPGLKLDKDGGTWVMTSLPDSSDSQIVRKADLKMNSEGTLEGKLTVTLTGLEAAWRRFEERNEDEAHRKKFLEDYVRETVPATIEVDLTNKPDWASSSPSLVAEYNLKVPGWVSGAGKRALLPVGLFSAPEKHVYEHATRVHPLYFQFMYQKADDVQIELPLGWQVSSLPQPVSQDAKLIVYNLKTENKNGTLHLERHLTVDLITLEQKYYPTLRNFYQMVKNSDEQQIVLQPVAISSSN